MFASVNALVDELIERVGNQIVLGLPVGIGKATSIADALLERARADSDLSLTIFTGLTLETPSGRGDFERRFLGPLIERSFSDWPTPGYAAALRADALPANVSVHEFYLRPGAWLGSEAMQRAYASVNYSHVVRTLLDLGVNVIAQLVSARSESDGYYSLGANPEITLDLLPYFERKRGLDEPVALVGQVNRQMPYMTGDAELPASHFDLVLDDGDDFPLFGLPSRAVSPADYATGMHVASLIPDGGTLQVGIGSLSEAVAHCLLLRNQHPDVFRRILERLPGGSAAARRSELPLHTEPFEDGLFAATELLSDALLALMDGGVVRRPAGSGDDAYIHAGFFVGSNAFYERLRSLSPVERERIRMTRISEVNTLFGDESRKREQRRNACFVNETMMLTLTGGAVADGLEDGRVVSGVGGQFDFVSMAQNLADAQSILMCRAFRLDNGRPRSNIRWNYGHITVPRHHRDVFVSEYGIAATRGLSDQRVIEALLGITDARFQPELAAAAENAGKLAAGWMDSAAVRNTPEAIQSAFADAAEYFPEYPLGSDFTPVERDLVRALSWLKQQPPGVLARARLLASAAPHLRSSSHRDAVVRMQLDKTSGFRERLSAGLLRYALSQTVRETPIEDV